MKYIKWTFGGGHLSAERCQRLESCFIICERIQIVLIVGGVVFVVVIVYHSEKKSITAFGMEDPELERIRTVLFAKAMEGRWEDVIKIYETDTRAHRAKITVSEDTALHIAILEAKEAQVENWCIRLEKTWMLK